MKKQQVKKNILLLLILLFISTIYSAIILFDLTTVEIHNEPFEYPKENTMEAKPLPSENTMIPHSLVE